MKKYLLVLIVLIASVTPSSANHTKGGWMYYEYLGPGINDPSKLRYKIGLNLYIDCSSILVEATWNFSFFKGSSPYTFIQDVTVPAGTQNSISGCTSKSCYPCIDNAPGRCYKIINYETIVELAPTADGYIISKQRCCRISGIQNLVAPSSQWGETFTINIPGNSNLASAPMNSSPKFVFNDTAVVCSNNPFVLNFNANDPDGDSLVYSFCNAYHGGDNGNNSNPTTASTPPYTPVPYASPYSGSSPLGAAVSINPQTGLISGIAPPVGEYVLCVCVSEYRNGIYIGETRKEIHLKTADCNPLKALLNPRNTTCDGFNVSFQNDYPSNPANTDYSWNFGEPVTGPLNTSTLPNPTHTYTDTGVYTVKLIVSLAGQCADSTSFQVKVYPGFVPGFTVGGGCFQNPFQFTDTTHPRYGVVNTWSWNFGDQTTLADTSHNGNPSWTFATPGPKTAQLIVTSTKGCIDTVTVDFNVLDKPTLTLPFKDTLICIPDAVTLGAAGTGTFTWTPPVRIVNANTATPTVNPLTDTWYHVQLNDNGCLNNDSVHVRVVAGVQLQAMADTTICLTDVVQLHAVTNGITFQWTPAATLDDPTLANPKATPTAASTTYHVRASIGTCFAGDDVVVNTVPYPVANAGPNPTICYNTSIQLNGSHDGNSFTWTPTSYLSDPTILNPVASPPRTTSYVLTVFDNAGCPKPGRDTVTVFVQPKVHAFAGNDTSVVVGQPLHFNGTGGVTYLWSPATGLDNVNIHNPVGVYGTGTDTIKYKLIVRDAIGCADSANITVTIFQTKSSIFVPTAFTPNGDGLNDEVMPIAVGMKRINYFSIYNRWGQLVFTTTTNKKGWDGKLNGRVQDPDVFVWMVSAVDYEDKPVFMKGTVTLIR